MKTKKENAIYETPLVELIHFTTPKNILASLSVVGELEDFEIGEDLE